MLQFAMSFLIAWLAEREPGLSGSAWSFGNDEIEAIPEGYYALVHIELKRVDRTPAEKKYEMCTKCGTAHEAGAICPYSSKKQEAAVNV
jgi:hypothetical protein